MAGKINIVNSIIHVCKELVAPSNYICLSKALLREPIDIILLNAFLKLMQKERVKPDRSLGAKFRRWYAKYQEKSKYKKTLKGMAILPKLLFFVDLRHISNEKQIVALFDSINLLQYEQVKFIFLTDPKQPAEIPLNWPYSIVASTSEVLEAFEKENYDYAVLLDRPCVLLSNICYRIIRHINSENPHDIFTTDHWQTIDSDQKDLHFCKPQFNLDYFLAYDFIHAPLIISKSTFSKQGFLNFELKHNYLYDLVLRSDYNKIGRLMHFTINAFTESEKIKKARALERRQIVEKFLLHHQIAAKIEDTANIEVLYLNRKVQFSKLVSIIIPFKDQVELLKSCVASVIKNTQNENFELVLISNNSSKTQTFEYLDHISNAHQNIRYFEYNVPFNFSEINNWAVTKCNGEYLLFLNNDTEVINSMWLSAMLKELDRKEVGAVGPILYYDDLTIQHAGVIPGIGHVAGHPHRFYKHDQFGYMNRLICVHELSCVTGACLLTKRELFDEVLGFDETNLPVSNNDVDYCLKLRKSGYKVIFTPKSLLYHHESKSRKSDISQSEIDRYSREVAYMLEKWRMNTLVDTFYNEQLSKFEENFSLNPEI